MYDKLLLNILSFIITYIIFLLVHIFIINRKRKDYKNGKQTEIYYIINKAKLDMNKTKYSTLKWLVTIINPLIISTTFIIVTNIKSYLIGLIVGFITLISLIYSCYELIGRYLKKKEGKKNV